MGYPPLTGNLISAPRANVIPGQNGGADVKVVNFTFAVNTDPIGRNVQLASGETQYMLVPQSDIFDVSVFDVEGQATALGLVSGQSIDLTPRSIKGGKPYKDKDDVTRYTAKIRAAKIVPGALPKQRTAAAAPAAAPAAAAATGAAPDDF